MQKLKELWTSLDQNIVVNKRELVLGVAACALAGIVIGTFLSPRITLTIGNNSGNVTGSATDSELQEEISDTPDEESSDEAAEE